MRYTIRNIIQRTCAKNIANRKSLIYEQVFHRGRNTYGQQSYKIMVNIIGDKLYVDLDDHVKPSYVIPMAKKVIILQISRLWEDSNS